MKTYVEIKFDSHDYTATVTEFGQLSKFLSEKDESFLIGDIIGDTPRWLTQELNMISRFAKSKNVTSNI